MPKPMSLYDAPFTFIGVFLTIGLLSLVFQSMEDVEIMGEDNLFVIPGSFGALCTLLFALPAAPLAQPRIVVLAHLLAMAAAIVIWLLLDDYVPWVQRGLAVAFTVTLMAVFQVSHPPAGAISLIFSTELTKKTPDGIGISSTHLLFLVISTLICVSHSLFVAVSVNNASPIRKFPSFW